MTTATPEQIRDLANSIAVQAEAIRDRTVAKPAAAVALLRENVETLRIWLLLDELTPSSERK